MNISDKILVLLSNENQVSLDRLCLLIGRDWEDIKEDVGVMRANKWLHAWTINYASTSKKLERMYAISDAGQEELRRRIAKAQEKP